MTWTHLWGFLGDLKGVIVGAVITQSANTIGRRAEERKRIRALTVEVLSAAVALNMVLYRLRRRLTSWDDRWPAIAGAAGEVLAAPWLSPRHALARAMGYVATNFARGRVNDNFALITPELNRLSTALVAVSLARRLGLKTAADRLADQVTVLTDTIGGPEQTWEAATAEFNRRLGAFRAAAELVTRGWWYRVIWQRLRRSLRRVPGGGR